MKSIYHFLGGIKFAIFLIASVAIFVIAGTLIESKTESHAYAAKLTYQAPLFSFFIWGFFINILFSATRRWPFKKKHIPFLITHLGLLMILCGVMIKNYFGTQGVMTLIEGTGSEEIALSNTQVIHIEDKNRSAQFDLTNKDIKFSDLRIKILDSFPHSKETYQSWIIDNVGVIYGHKNFPINRGLELKSIEETLYPNYPDFEIMGIKITEESDVLTLSKNLYLKGLEISIKDKKTQDILYQDGLEKALVSPPNWLDLKLDFDVSYFKGFSKAHLSTKITKKNQVEEIEIPIFGRNALRNINLSTPYLGSSPYSVTLKRKPLLLFIQDKEEDIFIFVYDQEGRVFSEKYLPGHLNSFIAYDKGFQGYSTYFKYPLNQLSLNEIENKSLLALKKHLEEADLRSCPPLHLLQDACQKNHLNFSRVLLNFLENQDKAHEIIYQGDFNLPPLDLSLVPDQELKSTYWISILLPAIMKKINEGHDFLTLLEITDWPLIDELKNIKINQDQNLLSEQLETLIGQIYELAEHLPIPESVNLKQQFNPKFFSSYLRLYSIYLHKMLPDVGDETELISLESPLIAKQEKMRPHQKLEANLPLVKMQIGNEIMHLSFDGKGNGLKWGTRDGMYLACFKPRFKSIPYRLRLRHARQIHYPNSPSSYSFEADLLITDKKLKKTSETTISMNHVYETWDGYRFYLSQISPGTQNDIQQVQIVVNHDPAKYYFTYPGALILTLGIFLLFWFKKKK